MKELFKVAKKGQRQSRRLVFNTTLASENLCCRERDQRFVLVTARIAFPKVPHAVLVQVLGPFRHEDGLTALSTGIREAQLGVFSGGIGAQLHRASSRRWFSPLRPFASVAE